MTDIARYQRLMLSVTFVLAAAGCMGLAIYASDNTSLVAGGAAGALAGILWLRMKMLAIQDFLNAANHGEIKGQIRSSFFGLALIAGVLILSVTFKEYLNPWTTLAGVLLPRFVLIGHRMVQPDLYMTPPAAVEGETCES